jgi:cell wall-associated NlpC family hydrolase/Trp operon repressor
MALGHSRSRRLSAAARVRVCVRVTSPSTLLFAAVLLATLLSAAVLLSLGASAAVAAPTDGNTVRLFGEVKTQVDALSNEAGFVQAEIDALDDELERSTEAYNQQSLKLDQLNVRMADLRRQLKEAEADHAVRVKKLEDRICAVYKSGGRDQLLQMLLLADGVEDLYNRIRLVSTLADQDQRLVEDLQKSADKLDEVLAEIDQNKLEELSVRRQLDDNREAIRGKLADRQKTLAGLDSQIKTVIEQERQRQLAEQEQLRLAIQNLVNGGQYYDGPLPQTDDEILNQFVQTAAYYLGIPYVWAGDRPSTGFDCSGFTSYVYAQHGVDLPHFSGYQAQMGIPVDPAEMEPGDLVAFGYPVHHVGIYIGDGLFIHAPRTGDVIKISHLSEKNNLSFIRRFELKPRIGAPWVG